MGKEMNSLFIEQEVQMANKFKQSTLLVIKEMHIKVKHLWKCLK